uniref:(northern house mosquito) hypothetical protein n=1 Tax=Culex pipiens TaxID=7175 RepID=A0A8D8B730_CULPI
MNFLIPASSSNSWTRKTRGVWDWTSSNFRRRRLNSRSNRSRWRRANILNRSTGVVSRSTSTVSSSRRQVQSWPAVSTFSTPSTGGICCRTGLSTKRGRSWRKTTVLRR